MGRRDGNIYNGCFPIIFARLQSNRKRYFLLQNLLLRYMYIFFCDDTYLSMIVRGCMTSCKNKRFLFSQ